MRYTNNLNLPDPMVAALMHDEYNAGLGQFTPSSLMRPPLMSRLTDLYGDKTVKDVADQFHLMMGGMVHNILEVSNYAQVKTQNTGGVRWVTTSPNAVPKKESSLREIRIYSQIGKYLIGAQFDHLWIDGGALQDYKNTTVYKFKVDYSGNLPDAKDWATQLNIMAFILRNNPMVEKLGKLVSFKEAQGIDPPEIKKLQIVGLLKDHSKTKAKRESGYPPHPIAVRDIDFLSDQNVIDYVNERGDAHMFAKTAKLIDIPECTDEETWAKPTKYAVMKTKTAKISSKNCDSYESACAYIKAKTSKPKSGFDNAFIEKRPGERTRCAYYCDVAQFCHYYQVHLNETTQP